MNVRLSVVYAGAGSGFYASWNVGKVVMRAHFLRLVFDLLFQDHSGATSFRTPFFFTLFLYTAIEASHFRIIKLLQRFPQSKRNGGQYEQKLVYIYHKQRKESRAKNRKH